MASSSSSSTSPQPLPPQPQYQELMRRLEDALVRQSALEVEMQELRRELEALAAGSRTLVNSTVARGLETAAELTQQALKDAARCCGNDELQRTLWTHLQEVQGPDAATRYQAYKRLRKLRDTRQVCNTGTKAELRTSKLKIQRCLLLLRDLVVFTVTAGRRPGTLDFADVLTNELLQGSAQDFENDELSQLTQAFNKICRLGAKREGFDEEIRKETMYGQEAEITPEQMNDLFTVYSSCHSAFPGYKSKNKCRGKVRRPRDETSPEPRPRGEESTELEPAAAAASASDSFQPGAATPATASGASFHPEAASVPLPTLLTASF